MHLLTLFTLLVFVASSSFVASDCSQVEQVKVTFYGWPDNDPPGPSIQCGLESTGDCNASSTTCTTTNNNINSNPSSAPSSAPSGNFGKLTWMNSRKTQDNNIQRSNSCGPRGEIAGGTGTYDDPLTMASAGNWFCHLEIVYLPYLQKYLRYEDYCQECVKDAPKVMHIDIWTGSNTTNGGNLQLQCEDILTPTPLQSMIRSPAPNLTVDPSTLFIPNGKSGLCNGTAIYQTSDAGILYLARMKIWLTCTLLFLILQNCLFD